MDDKIRVNTEVNPKLDPNSPEFDPEAAAAAMASFADNLKSIRHVFAANEFSQLISNGDPSIAGAVAEACASILELLKNYTPEKNDMPVQSKAACAEQNGAIMTIGERLFVPSDPEYKDAFITAISAPGLFRKEKGGVKKELALNISAPFLQALAKATLIDFINDKYGETRVYFPKFARELGFDINHSSVQIEREKGVSRSEARQIFINNLLIDIDNIWGKLPNDREEYKLISVHSYNPGTENLCYVSPYFQGLIKALIKKESRRLDSGEKYCLWSCDLLHATAANERNRAAVEMATRILVGVMNRGSKPDSKLPQNKGKPYKDPGAITYSISCARLIQECPQIRERLKEQPTTSRKTIILKRTFTAMYNILRTKTDLFSYYADLTISEVIPTAKTLDAKITIQHHGINPNYQRPFLPIGEG